MGAAADVPPGPPSSTANLKRQVSAQRNPANTAPRHGWGFTHLDSLMRILSPSPSLQEATSDAGVVHIIGLPGKAACSKTRAQVAEGDKLRFDADRVFW
jgi:hypothetical protein